MLQSNLAFTMLLALMMTGCGGPPETSKPPPEAAAADAEDTVFGDTVATMDKARAVEATAAEHKQQLDEAVQRAEDP